MITDPPRIRLVIDCSEGLELRYIRLADAADIFNIINRERDYLGKWLPFVAFTKTIDDTRNYIRSILRLPKDQTDYVFVIRYQRQTVGLAGFKDTDRINLKTEIGYWLSQSFQGKGIMIRSVKGLIRFAFNELGLNCIKIRCAVGNSPSRHIPQKLGFQLEGIERAGERMQNGEFVDLEDYSLLQKDPATSDYINFEQHHDS